VTLPDGRKGVRETDTFDTFVESSWYFARFCSANYDAGRSIAPPSTTGCRSTSISAASSTRSCICSIPASSPAPCRPAAISISPSPSPGLFTQGMVTHQTYRAADGQWLQPDEVKKSGDGWTSLDGRAR
jgi:leucyl-tRNA synthetase